MNIFFFQLDAYGYKVQADYYSCGIFYEALLSPHRNQENLWLRKMNMNEFNLNGKYVQCTVEYNMMK